MFFSIVQEAKLEEFTKSQPSMSGFARLQPMILNTNMNQFGNVMGLSFIHAISLMIFNCMDAQVKFFGNHFTT
jgi:hypothetical protein